MHDDDYFQRGLVIKRDISYFSYQPISFARFRIERELHHADIRMPPSALSGALAEAFIALLRKISAPPQSTAYYALIIGCSHDSAADDIFIP